MLPTKFWLDPTYYSKADVWFEDFEAMAVILDIRAERF